MKNLNKLERVAKLKALRLCVVIIFHKEIKFTGHLIITTAAVAAVANLYIQSKEIKFERSLKSKNMCSLVHSCVCV